MNGQRNFEIIIVKESSHGISTISTISLSIIGVVIKSSNWYELTSFTIYILSLLIETIFLYVAFFIFTTYFENLKLYSL